MTTRREVNRPRPRLALAGGLSAITRPFPPLLFQDWRKVRQDEGRLETGRERKQMGGKEVYMYVYAWRQGGGMWRCTGSKSDVRSCGGGPDGGREKSVMDAQLHTDINIDIKPTT